MNKLADNSVNSGRWVKIINCEEENMSEVSGAEIASKKNLRLLMEGKLPWEDVKRMCRISPKEEDRFWKYIDILQEKVPWKEKILLRISDQLYIVAKDGKRMVKCECGHEFGDYRVNWKLSSLVYVRKTREEMDEIYSIEIPYPEVGLAEIREYYCPGCLAQLNVEIAPPGYPPLFEMLPDLDAFYRQWLGKPLPDEHHDWFQDKTLEEMSGWTT